MGKQHQGSSVPGRGKGGGLGVGVVPPEELRDTAERVAETVYAEKHARFGTRVPPSSKAFSNDRCWSGYERVALLCIERGWDPAAYVRFCYETMQDNGAFILPGDMVNDRVSSAYARAVEEEADFSSPDTEWRFNEQELYKRAGEDRQAGTRFLMSPLYPFPAWYRFVKGNSRIERAWREMAADDLGANPALRSWLSDRFPKKVERMFK